MGEIADDIMNGICCAICGCYFVENNNDETLYEHGYPVACEECWEPNCGYEKADDNVHIL